MITGQIFGTIKRAGKIIEPEGRARFLAVVIESSKDVNGKVYAQTVDCMMYGKLIDGICPAMSVGRLAYATGDIGLSKNTKDGKDYTNIKIVGAIGLVGGERQTQPMPIAEPQQGKPEQDGGKMPF